MTTTDLRERLVREGEARLREGYHCSEAMLLTLGPLVRQPWDPTYLRLATGLAGGIGETNDDACGALTGGVMVLGAALGRTTVVDDQALMTLVAEFRRRFIQAYGVSRCGTIRATVIKNEGGLGSCAVLVGQVVSMLYDLLNDAGLIKEDIQIR